MNAPVPTHNPLQAALSKGGFGALLDAGRALGKAMKEAATPAEPKDELTAIRAESAAMHDLKSRAWDMARESASERGAVPSMTDYLIATQSPEMLAAVADQGLSGKWTPAAIVNFKDMTLTNVQLNARDFDHHNLTAQEREALDMTDDEISQFYSEVGNNVECHSFRETSFDPSTEINHYVRHPNATVINCTFNGLQSEDTLELKDGHYENIRFTNIQGGEIIVADGAQVKGMDISGAHAELTIGKASVMNLDATGAHLVRINAAPGAEITHATFEGATISMASTMVGVKLNDVHFENASLNDVNLSHATLNGVSFNETALAGLDLTDAQIINMKINGEPVRDVHELAALGVTVSESTTVESREQPSRMAAYEPVVEFEQITAPIIAPDYKGAAIERMALASGGGGAAVSEAATALNNSLANLPITLPLGISGGEHVQSLSEAHEKGAGAQVASNSMQYEKPAQEAGMAQALAQLSR